LQHGADVNTRDNNGVSPLFYAVGTHNLKLLRALIERGADVDVVSEANRMTPLLVAVENGDTAAAVLLLDHGANVNAGNQLGYSPLMAAAEAGQVAMVSLLLSRGANPRARDQEGMDASTLARKRGYREIVDLLAVAGSN
ncbi:MAG: ankyrin repeat domain-containing protein, partial [Halieaceae bacterium]|jgi:ankyrin repeat protein|nr:ankyrin repeat domain-containing protein [Halieaceae bacterium]